MATINGKGQKQLTQTQLLSLIQSYLGSSLFKHTMQYQSFIQTHAQYLEFIHAHIPLETDLPTKEEKYVFASLFKDVEAKVIINMHLVRILHQKNTLLCLAIDNDIPINDQKFYILAIIFQDTHTARQWKNQYSFLTLLRVAEPYRSTHKVSMHSTTTMLLTRPQNIKIQNKFKLQQYSTESVKIQGNLKFRQRKYVEALYQYQFGLGLAHSPENRRERAILYANSSQCLFQMRLYQSALTYADISVAIDKKYAKGIYRKFTCHLELRDLKQAPTALRAIHAVCTPAEFQTAQTTFFRNSLNHHGVYDWRDVFAGGNLHFGEYFSPSLSKTKEEGEPFSLLDPLQNHYIAAQDIPQYEMIMFCKPLIYCNSQQEKFGENYSTLINEIMTYCDLEDSFYDKFQALPSQCEFQGHVLKFNKFNPGGVEMNEVHAKCLRCLELEKVVGLGQGQKECLGIWEQLYKFKHQCLSNCTYIHIKGGLAVFAVKSIEQGQPLSIDFLNWQTTRRDTLMLQKLGRGCDCNFCKWQWDSDFNTRSGEILYAFYKHQSKEWHENGSQKLNLYYLWNLIYVKHFREIQLMKQYLAILQKYPLWECIINCLKYLRITPKNDVFDYIKSMVKKFFEKYFKMNHHDAVELLKTVL